MRARRPCCGGCTCEMACPSALGEKFTAKRHADEHQVWASGQSKTQGEAVRASNAPETERALAMKWWPCRAFRAMLSEPRRTCRMRT